MTDKKQLNEDYKLQIMIWEIKYLMFIFCFQAHSDFSNMEAVISYLQFVPVEDEIIDFFRPVANQILQKLRAKPCVPTQPNSKGRIHVLVIFPIKCGSIYGNFDGKN